MLMLGASMLAKAQVTWYFGNKAKLMFNGASTSTSAGSQLNTSEGSAVLVDKNNNVVMYVDGQKAWNGSNVLQTTVGFKGDSSSTQTIVIVPRPGTLGTRAFVFSVNAVENNYGNSNTNVFNGLDGLRVSEVAISGTAPNTTITNVYNNYNLTPGVLMAERLTVTEDGEGGYWVLTHGVGIYNNNPAIAGTTSLNNVGERNFYAYHVTCGTTSVQDLDDPSNEIISNITNVTPNQSFYHVSASNPNYSNSQQFNGQGQLKFNKAGTKIALTLPWFNNTLTGGLAVVNPVGQLFNFDKTTGIVSGAIEFNLGFQAVTGATKDASAYGVEFSPDGTRLYVSSYFGSSAFGTGTSRVYQYSISSGVPATITSSKVQVASIANSPAAGSLAALMRGPNDKVYVARNGSTSIDVINSPNSAGAACNYVSNTVPVTGTCRAGLPTTVLISNNPAIPVITGASTFCKGSVFTFNTTYTGNEPSGVTWETYGSNAAGAPIDANGNVVANTYSSFYYFGQSPMIYTSPMTFPNLTTDAVCGKYYSLKITLFSECGSVINTAIKTFYVQCNNPAFNITTNTGNSSYYTVSSVPVDVNAASAPGFNYCWRIEGYDANFVNQLFKFDLCQATGVWANYPGANVYKGFDHITYNYSGPNPTPAITSSSNPAIGQFRYDYNYKLIRATANSACGWKEAVYYLKVMSSGRLMNGQLLTKPHVIFSEDVNDLTIDETTGINPTGKNEFFTVYPNPSNGVFTIELKNENNATMEVFDMTGKLIKAAQLTKNDRFTLNLSDYAKGVYMIKMNGAEQHMQKIILE